MGIAPSLFYLSNHPLLSARRTPYVESMRRRGAAKLPSGGLNAAEAEEGAGGCAGAAMPAGGASGTEAAEEGGTSGTDTPREGSAAKAS